MWRGKFDRSMTWFLRAGRHDVRANASRKMGAQVFFNAWERLWVPTCTSRGATFTSALAIRPGTSPLLFAIASIGKRHHALMNAIASGAFECSDVKAGRNGRDPCQHHLRFASLEKLAKASQNIGRQIRTYPKYGQTRWLPRAGGIGPIVRMGRHIGQPGSPEQVVLLFARWKPRGFLSDLSSERCDAIPQGRGLFGTAVHDVAPIIRLN